MHARYVGQVPPERCREGSRWSVTRRSKIGWCAKWRTIVFPFPCSPPAPVGRFHPLLGKTDRRTGRQADRQTDGPADGQVHSTRPPVHPPPHVLARRCFFELDGKKGDIDSFREMGIVFLVEYQDMPLTDSVFCKFYKLKTLSEVCWKVFNMTAKQYAQVCLSPCPPAFCPPLTCVCACVHYRCFE
jgi:hypothetical protein